MSGAAQPAVRGAASPLAGRRAARRPRSSPRRIRWTSAIARTACVGSAVLAALVLVVMLAHLVAEGTASLSWALITEVPIARGMEGHPGGLAHAIVGTGILLALAGAVGIPVGVLIGIFLAEYAAGSRIAAPVRFVCDVLAGLPSIVIGIVGYELLVVPLGNYNGYAGALALSLILVPIVARATEEMLLLVPRSHREASIALGATRAQTILRVVIPGASGGLVTGILLALARAAGETAPLLFTALGSRLMTLDPAQPLPSLTVQVFNYATGPYREEQALAWSGMLVLIALVFVLNLLVRGAVRSRLRGRTA